MRLDFIDGLRAIGAYLVVVIHTGQGFLPLAMSGHWMFHVLEDYDVSRVGLMLLLLISGFVIPSSLKPGDPNALQNFLVRRLWRLYPAFWAGLAAAYGALWVWGDAPAWTPLAANASMLPHLFHQPLMVAYLWTLQVELAFYALCALWFRLKLLGNPLWLLAVALLCALLTATGTEIPGLVGLAPGAPTASLYYLGFMHWAALYRSWWYHPERPPRRLALVTVTALGLMLPNLWTLLHTAPEWRTHEWHTSLGIPVFVLGTTVLRPRGAWLARLGESSYSLYLLHQPVFTLVLWVLSLHAVPELFKTMHLGVYLVVCTLLSTLAARLMFHAVEQPAIRLSRRFTRVQPRTVEVPQQDLQPGAERAVATWPEQHRSS